MSNALREMRESLISHRFAVVVISILFGASAAGWIMTELLPPDLLVNAEEYAERYGETFMRIAAPLRLHDPFHSFWYRGILALFFFVLLLCILTRWGRVLLRSLRIDTPADEAILGRRKIGFEIYFSDLVREGRSRDPLAVLERRYGRKEPVGEHLTGRILARITFILRRRGYAVRSVDRDGTILFAAAAGRWRAFGNFLFHISLLVITVGGMIGSFWGKSEMHYGTAGDRLPLSGSPYTLVVKDFDIILTELMEVKSYLSTVSIVDTNADTLVTAGIEVNRPLHFEGYKIYQSSYYADEKDFRWARIDILRLGSIGKTTVTLGPGEEMPVEGTGLKLRARRFFPDFRTGPGGAYSASASMVNPALEVELVSEEGVRRGWLFLFHPRFNTRFTLPVSLTLVDVEPIFYTGLQVKTNPGAPVFLIGMAIATVGLAALYLLNDRSVQGSVNAERVIVAGISYRWKFSFTGECAAIEAELRNELSRYLAEQRMDPV